MPIPNANDVTGAQPTTELSKDEIFDIISSDEPEEDKIDLSEKKEKVKIEEITEEEEKPKKKVEKEEGEEEEEEEEEIEIDELDEIEKDLEEPDEDELELVTPVPRSVILKKYPKLFEEFPYLEKAYYRERAYTEVFPSPQDAKDANIKAQTLDKFEEQLLSGDLSEIIKEVRKEDENSFKKLADNYLLSLSKVDEPAYHHVVGNIIKSTIYNMVKEARAMGEKDGSVLQNAAAILNQFVFGTSQFTAAKQLSTEESNEKSARERELEQKEENFRKQKFETARDSLDIRLGNKLKATISAYIDPKKTMTDYVRRNAERDALENVYKFLEKDSRFRSLKDKLWENAFKNDYDSNSVGRIESAFLSRAKTLLPSVIKKARNEALRGMGKRVKDDVEEESESSEKEAPIRRGSTPPDKSRQIRKGEIPQGMSNKDYIMSD